jgi:DNA polymerase delta subunit 4
MSTRSHREIEVINLAKSRSTLTQHVKQEVKGQTVARGLQTSEDLADIEMRLRRSFDMETKYGPVSGMSRLERYERAEKLQLGPPSWVKQVIEAHGVDSDLNKHVFSPGKV